MTRSTLLLLACLCTSPLHAAWFKGNTHTHTSNSDGDSTPDDVVKWYREHGYDFVMITDHEMITDVAPLNALFGGGGQFLVVAGEEVTANYPGQPPLAVHVNALAPRERVIRQKGTTPRETLRINVDAIHAAGAIAQVNHPNFRWQLKGDDIASVKGAQLLEIANMHPIVNSLGAGPDFPSAEAIWDQALSLGAVIYGVASDDVHHLKTGESSAIGTAGENSRPGKGWIVVRAEKLAAEDLMASIVQGDFYASTGVTLKDYHGDPHGLSLTIQPTKPDVTFATKFRVQFIGKEGKVLRETVATSEPVTFVPRGDEGYVRVRVTDSNGRQAWTQPVFLDSRRPAEVTGK